MPASATTERVFRWAPWWVVAQVALWPTVGIAEAVLSLGALFALAALAWRRFQGGTELLTRGAWALTSAMFLTYWLPEMLSAPVSVNPARAAREALVDLRYLPFLWLVAMAVATERGRRITLGGIGVVAGIWLLDGMAQALFNISLGGVSDAERLTGVFGAGNPKLGLVLASLAPFLLHVGGRLAGSAGWLAIAALLVAVVLMAGARAAWLTLSVVLAVAAVHRFGWRFSLRVGLATLVLAATAALFSERLQGRLERTAEVLVGGEAGLDHALSGRLPIWRAAIRMYQEHPINGVGVRGFRDAYAGHAPADDPWLQGDHDGAFHAHQIVLEVASETGSIGLLIWLAGVALAWRAWKWSSPEARQRARIPAMALAVTVFPFNTHLAFYSTFWGGLTLLLAALYAGSLMAAENSERS
ncbi:MAG TPA: hypothetical protein DDZ76_15480 [Xanthomonadales bacterium]|nr:hypothetical protein [Xanthomonadales bacterium]